MLIAGIAALGLVGTTNGVRAEGPDTDPLLVVQPRRGPVGTTVHVAARCGQPLRLLTVRFYRPANLDGPELLDAAHFFEPDRPDRTHFAVDFEVPATLSDAVTDRFVPVLPGLYVVDAHCYGGRNLDLRALFCVPECRINWELIMHFHLGTGGFHLADPFRILTTLAPGIVPQPLIVGPTTTVPRPKAPQPAPTQPAAPPPPPEVSTTTTLKPCVGKGCP